MAAPLLSYEESYMDGVGVTLPLLSGELQRHCNVALLRLSFKNSTHERTLPMKKVVIVGLITLLSLGVSFAGSSGPTLPNTGSAPMVIALA